MDAWQQAIIASREKYIFVNASRQSGKSSSVSIKAAQVVIGKPNSLVLIIAEQKQSNEDIRKVRQIIKTYDKILRKKYDGKITLDFAVDNKTSFELGHGGRCIALPGNEISRGYSAPDLVIIDEAGYVDDHVFAAVDPMIEVNPYSQLVILGTPNGTGGFYYHESKSPRYGDTSLTWPHNPQRFRIPYQMCPRISAESIEQKRIIYGDAYVKQEYECVFLDDVSGLFTEAAMRNSMDENEDAFSKEMTDINDILHGGAEMI